MGEDLNEARIVKVDISEMHKSYLDYAMVLLSAPFLMCGTVEACATANSLWYV